MGCKATKDSGRWLNTINTFPRENLWMPGPASPSWSIFGEPTLAALIRTNIAQDQAHLANERMSVNNLLKGKAVLERFFWSVASKERNA
jgi:hypothetical protein